MNISDIERVLKQNKTVKAQYRTEYNFLEWNIVLSDSVETETVEGTVKHFILIGNLNNKVYLENIIKVQSAWLA